MSLDHRHNSAPFCGKCSGPCEMPQEDSPYNLEYQPTVKQLRDWLADAPDDAIIEYATYVGEHVLFYRHGNGKWSFGLRLMTEHELDRNQLVRQMRRVFENLPKLFDPDRKES